MQQVGTRDGEFSETADGVAASGTMSEKRGPHRRVDGIGDRVTSPDKGGGTLTYVLYWGGRGGGDTSFCKEFYLGPKRARKRATESPGPTGWRAATAELTITHDREARM